MTKKMLIDASHPEETRVVVVNGTQLEELDFESSRRKQLRGNIYLARVTRVEPSLQAAFVEYGGNRHGFLAFSEIHPDYYQIPFEDRQALLAEEEAEAVHADAEDDDEDNGENGAEEHADDDQKDAADESAQMQAVRRKKINRRRYKIQEVIKRGQIMLVQVVKEERGNKGAALTTYLSLAGRYCVLMPNTPRGGGISRKISSGGDRKRLKEIVSELNVAKGTGVIVRTAGASRNKSEIKRDYDYLIRLWENIRQETLKSIAPSLIHEEGDLVKRSIRDLYNKDIDQVLVEGDAAYKAAKSFMKTLVPSHAKKVQPYTDSIPLFQRFHVEDQLESSHNSVAQLKSGGYLVIHPTEALVSVDVNSGRSTKERNIEKTALKTNLEAAEEVARQMRLRDLAGLIVIDFIDMDENKHVRAVEKKMKDVLKMDRARVQNSRISQFGLMEISRQRRRRSLLEGSTTVCPHCQGIGRMRSIESSALKAVRAAESEGVKGGAARIRLKTAPDVALYIFNNQRNLLTGMEERFDMFVELEGDDNLIRPAYEIEKLETRSPKDSPVHNDQPQQQPEKSDNDEPAESKASEKSEDSKSDDDAPKKRRRRRSRRKSRGSDNAASTPASLEVIHPEGTDPEEVSTHDETDKSVADSENAKSDDKPKRRRRRRSKKSDAPSSDTPKDEAKEEAKAESSDETKAESSDEKPKPKRRRRTKKSDTKDGESSEAKTEAAKDDSPGKAEDEKPKRKRAPRKTAKKDEPKAETSKPDEAAPEDKPKPKRRSTRKPKAESKPDEPAKTEEKPKAKAQENPAEDDNRPKKKGWWQRTIGS